MRNFQDNFETRKRSFISAFSICMTVPLRKSITDDLICHEKAWTSARACKYNSRSFQCFVLPENTDSIFLVAIF